MVNQEDIKNILKSYDFENITIGVLGGHSALDVSSGVKKYGFNTVAVCQKGREKTYSKYYKTRDGRGCIDEVIVLDSFGELVNRDIQKQLQEMNTIFVHNRYFWVYFDFARIENDFFVPIYGTRNLVKFEERDIPKNQYYMLEKAGIRFPRIFSTPDKIDRLVIVKVSEAIRGYERAFFFASSPKEYEQKSNELIEKGIITKEALKKAVIEEYILGAQTNFNFFYSNVREELELMGTDTRRQTNLDGILRLPANEQLEVLKYVKPKMIETGHITCTTKESILEKAFEIGEKFVEITKKEYPPGIIGPFALQGAVASYEGKEEIVIFDVSMRIPGSPGTKFTPHTGYLYGKEISYGERIGMELRESLDKGVIYNILS
jgi:5-formaminoimidazole-4-carboxamide-1-(beta)-D-ribofuranosyl 5'-monophosphate synthetase